MMRLDPISPPTDVGKQSPVENLVGSQLEIVVPMANKPPEARRF